MGLAKGCYCLTSEEFEDLLLTTRGLDRGLESLHGDSLLHYFASSGDISKKMIKRMYPWFELKNRTVTREIIDEILSTSKSVKYILED